VQATTSILKETKEVHKKWLLDWLQRFNRCQDQESNDIQLMLKASVFKPFLGVKMTS